MSKRATEATDTRMKLAMKKIPVWAGIVCCVLALAGCGGGGGDAGTPQFQEGGGGSNGQGAATANLILTLSSVRLANTDSGSVTVTATAVDAANNTLAAVPIDFSSDNGGVLTPSGTLTGADGQLTATLGIGGNQADRVITVTAVSGSVSKTATVQVAGTAISSVLVPAVIAPGTNGEVQYRVVDQAGSPMTGQQVQIVATGLNPAQAIGVTGVNGDYVFSYTSPAAAGSYSVAANIAGKTDVQTIQVQSPDAESSVPAADLSSVTSASVSASPIVVAVNSAAGAANRSDIRALFQGAGNTPIPNVRVRFDLNGDPNSIGGRITTTDQILYSDSNGVVTAAYVPGVRSSPTDGVMVRACYGATDAEVAVPRCPNSKLVKLTVTAQPINVTIGTNELVVVNELTFQRKYIVTVTDSAGVAMPDVNLSVLLDLPNYRKGFYARVGSVWVKQGASDSGDAAVCLNEDTNRNGVSDVGEDKKDYDLTNPRIPPALWPRKADVAVSWLNQPKTGADGTAVLVITYAKDHGSWVDALITVSASGVSGTEGRDSRLVAPVPVDAASIKAESSPAYQASPYGISTDCTNPN